MDVRLRFSTRYQRVGVPSGNQGSRNPRLCRDGGGGMTWQEKVAALEAFYQKSFGKPQFVSEVFTSGSYAKKVRALARLGRRTPEEVSEVCLQVDHLRRAFKVMDDLIDEDIVRDGEKAFWVIHGAESTVEQAATDIK